MQLKNLLQVVYQFSLVQSDMSRSLRIWHVNATFTTESYLHLRLTELMR